jgi:hypothetical protein
MKVIGLKIVANLNNFLKMEVAILDADPWSNLDAD